MELETPLRKTSKLKARLSKDDIDYKLEIFDNEVNRIDLFKNTKLPPLNRVAHSRERFYSD